MTILLFFLAAEAFKSVLIKGKLFEPTAVWLPLNPQQKLNGCSAFHHVTKHMLIVELTKAVIVNTICVGDVTST